jgi:hypothetical protein
VTAGWQGGGESTGAATVADQLRTHAIFLYIFNHFAKLYDGFKILQF